MRLKEYRGDIFFRKDKQNGKKERQEYILERVEKEGRVLTKRISHCGRYRA